MTHFMVAAAHKSSGKTTISTGLAAAFRARGLRVQPFKKGPDYIDPMWLTLASGQPCYNFDFHTMPASEIRSVFHRRMGEGDIGIIESNKGLFDGLDVDGSDSNAALAKLLKAPVVLVLDTSGITRGIAPLLYGYERFDPGIEFAGVILNKVGGPRHEAKLRAAIENYSDLPMIGAVWRDHDLEIGERHLGLTMPMECAGSELAVGRMRDAVAGGVDVDRLIRLNTPLSEQDAPWQGEAETTTGRRVRIGIAMDAAFRFYYPDDLEAFGAAGADLIAIDTLSDQELPDIDGLFIGGGFPEVQMRALEANKTLRRSIKTAHEAGMPAYAECGGLAYLSRSLTWGSQSCEMVGVIPGDTRMHDLPQGRGYVRFKTADNQELAGYEPSVGQTVPAHEFHYSSVEGLPPDSRFTRIMQRGHGIDGVNDGLVIGNLMAGYCHLRNTSNNPWVRRFVERVRRQSN